MAPERADESLEGPRGASRVALVVMGIVSVFLAILLVTLAGTLFSVGGRVSSHPDPEPHPGVGEKLAELHLQVLTGADEPATLTLDGLTGKVVLVNFWGTWCPPCRTELPHIAKLASDRRDRSDFKLLAVSCGRDLPEETETLRTETEDFLRQRRIDMPTYCDPASTTRVAFYEVAALNIAPLTFVMDRQGVIRGIWPGYAPGIEEEMAELIDRLLEE